MNPKSNPSNERSNSSSAGSMGPTADNMGSSTVLAFLNEVQNHVMEGHEEIEHMICHRSTGVQDVMCQQQSGDPEHMMELEALLAD